MNLSSKVIDILKGKTLSTAESCTGGGIGAALTAVPGSSAVYMGGVISYDNAVKMGVLGVPEEWIEKYGAVSKETAKEMAENIRKISGADLGVSVTGAAGPDGTEGHPPGYVFIAVSGNNGTEVKLLNIKPLSRNFVRESAVSELFKLINIYLEEL